MTMTMTSPLKSGVDVTFTQRSFRPLGSNPKMKKGASSHRNRLIAYYGNTCFYCAVPLSRDTRGNFLNPNAPTLDHVVTRLDGGSNTLVNIVVACYQCNHKRGSKNFWVFLNTVHATLSPKRLIAAQAHYEKFVNLNNQTCELDDDSYQRFINDFFVKLMKNNAK